MIVITAFAGDIQEPSPGGFPPNLVVRILETRDANELLWADIQVQAEEPFELTNGDEVGPGQLADGDPPFCLMNGSDQG